jgi:phosphoglycolate phosphatase-like HAD superfamily hydrolase
MNKNDLKKIVKNLETKSTFIFDFDGVLAHSVDLKTQAFAKIYQPFGQEVSNQVVDFHTTGNGGMSRIKKFKYFHSNYLNIEISPKDLDNACNTFSKLVKESVINCAEVQGSKSFLKKYSNSNKLFFINTATPTFEMLEIIKERGLNDFFEAIYGSPNSKLENFNNIFYRYNIKPSDTIFFGDLMADFYAAENAGCDFIGIGGRINKDEIILKSTNRYGFIKNFDDLLKIS